MTIKSGLPTPSLATLLDEPGERRDGIRADMVLDALGVAARGVGVDAQRQEEGIDHLVAFAAGLGEGLAFRGEERAAVRLLHHKAGLHQARSEEHTSELQSLMRHSYAVFCLNKKNSQHTKRITIRHNIERTQRH